MLGLDNMQNKMRAIKFRNILCSDEQSEGEHNGMSSRGHHGL
jgi:hypothetical protein